jgi:hypothetical protein
METRVHVESRGLAAHSVDYGRFRKDGAGSQLGDNYRFKGLEWRRLSCRTPSCGICSKAPLWLEAWALTYTSGVGDCSFLYS